MTSIFIKTYFKDFQWLQYLLPSIEKYSEGFESVVIVSDNDGHMIPDEYVNTITKIPVTVIYENLPAKTPSYVEHGVGYLWQQYIKLHWYKYCSSDAILILDSDEMLTQKLCPDDFKYNGKWIWNYRPWSKAGAGICWKQSTDQLLRIDTVYDAMCITGFIMTKRATHRLLTHIAPGDLWDFVVKMNMPTMSEFNLFGSYIYHTNDDDYYCNIEFTTPVKNNTILKRWSWGGISKEIDMENRKHL